MTTWRIVLTTSTRNGEIGDWTGVAPSCPRELEPGGPHDDVFGLVPDGFYKGCCPGVVLECGDRHTAADIVEVLNRCQVTEIPPAVPYVNPSTGLEICRRCGRDYGEWSAPSPIWNAVMRDGDINNLDEPFDGIVCANCFIALADEAGVATSWRVYPTSIVDSSKVALTTPSGRVWDESAWLWRNTPESYHTDSDLDDTPTFP